jgi:hypothetical protein
MVYWTLLATLLKGIWNLQKISVIPVQQEYCHWWCLLSIPHCRHSIVDTRPFLPWLLIYQKSLNIRLDSGSSWLDGVNGILMQQEPNSPKQDYWNQRAIASLANTLITVMEPVPMPLLSSMLLLQL